MKKVNPFLMYSLRDVEKRTGIKEDKIKSLLEEKKNIGRKIGNYWFVRGREIREINRLLKDKDEKEK